MEAAVEHDRVLVEIGALARLAPALRRAHARDAQAVLAAVHAAHELLDDLGRRAGSLHPRRRFDQLGHSRSASLFMPRSRAAAAPPSRSVGVSGGSSTSSSRNVAMSLYVASCGSRRELLRRGVSRSAPSTAFSSEPQRCSRSAAVFSPTPFAPGMPSEGSPRSAMKSGTSSGGMP